MDTQAGRVVVGYDGSPHAGAVLDRAAEADQIGRASCRERVYLCV